MHILIQKISTGLFWQEGDMWTSDKNAARNFDTTSEAIQFCKERQLKGAQGVVKFKTVNIPEWIFSLE
jgi:hypothetical protein